MAGSSSVARVDRVLVARPPVSAHASRVPLSRPRVTPRRTRGHVCGCLGCVCGRSRSPPRRQLGVERLNRTVLPFSFSVTMFCEAV